MSKRRTKSDKKKPPRPVNVGKQVLSKMRLLPRVDALEKFRNEYIESAEHKVKFDASVLFSVNGIVRALLDKNVITMEELNKGREEAVKEYVKEQQEREAFEAKKKLVMETFSKAKEEHPDWNEDQCKEAAMRALAEKEVPAEVPVEKTVEQTEEPNSITSSADDPQGRLMRGEDTDPNDGTG